MYLPSPNSPLILLQFTAFGPGAGRGTAFALLARGGKMADKSKSSEEGPAAAAPARKKKSKLVLIIALILVLGAGSAGGYIFFIRNPANVKAAAQKGKKKEIAPAPDEGTAEDEEVDKKGKDKAETRKDKANKPAISLPEDEDVKQVIEVPSFILN